MTTRVRCVSVKWNANRLLSDFLLRIEFLLILYHSTCVRKFNLHLLVRVLTKEVLCELCVSHTYVLRLIVRCSSGVGTWKWGTRKLSSVFLNQMKTSILSVTVRQTPKYLSKTCYVCICVRVFSVYVLCLCILFMSVAVAVAVAVCGCICAFCPCPCLYCICL